MLSFKKLVLGTAFMAISAASSALTVNSVVVTSVGITSAGAGTIAVDYNSSVGQDCFLGIMTVAATTDNGKALLDMFKFAKQNGLLVNVNYTKLTSSCRADSVATSI